MRLVLFHPVPELIVALIDAGVDANIQVAGVTPLLIAIDARDVALMTYRSARRTRKTLGVVAVHGRIRTRPVCRS
jgi:hypothetical protein